MFRFINHTGIIKCLKEKKIQKKISIPVPLLKCKKIGNERSIVREIILKNFPHLSILLRNYRYQNSENFWWCYHKTSVLGPPKFSAFISEKFDKTLICYTIVYLAFVICTFHIFILKWHIAPDILYLGTEKKYSAFILHIQENNFLDICYVTIIFHMYIYLDFSAILLISKVPKSCVLPITYLCS